MQEENNQSVETANSVKSVDAFSNDSFFKFTKENLVLKLVMFIAVIIVVSKYINNFDTVDEKIRSGILALNVVGLFIAFIALPQIKIGPWIVQLFFKIVQSAVFVYFINLVFLIMFDKEMTRYILASFDPKLGERIEEHDYATDCRFYTPENPTSNFANLTGAVDMFISAHFIGWLVKSFIFRNNIMCWVMSIGFETYELSFRHWLPNFYECWWDHLLLDVFGCNLAGILIGNYIQKKLNMEKFHWFFEPNEKSEQLPYFKRFWFAITGVEDYVINHKWHFLASPSNLLTVLFVIFQSSLIDLSYFFNKTQLNMPPTHIILVLRTFPIGFYSIVVVHQLYYYARNKSPDKKIPFDLALAQFLQLAEIILFIKNFEPEIYITSTPTHVNVFWIVIGIILFMCFSYSCYNQKKKFLKQ